MSGSPRLSHFSRCNSPHSGDRSLLHRRIGGNFPFPQLRVLEVLLGPFPARPAASPFCTNNFMIFIKSEMCFAYIISLQNTFEIRSAAWRETPLSTTPLSSLNMGIPPSPWQFQLSQPPFTAGTQSIPVPFSEFVRPCSVCVGRRETRFTCRIGSIAVRSVPRTRSCGMSGLCEEGIARRQATHLYDMQ